MEGMVERVMNGWTLIRLVTLMALSIDDCRPTLSGNVCIHDKIAASSDSV